MKDQRSAWRGRLVTVWAVFAIALSLPAFGNDFSDAIAAYQKGDYDTAHDLWAPLAESGDARAQFNLALLYGNGLGRPLDREAARGWFEAAAEQGNVQAQYNLARMLQSGDGVQADIAAARGWYEKAARQDFAPAQNNLALMYLEGQGMPRDRARAVRWFSRAAESSPEARNNLNGLAVRLPQARVMAGLVNLRAGPSMQSQILDQVSREDSGVLLEQRGGWSRLWFVDYDSIGWIADRLLAIDRTPAEDAPVVGESDTPASAIAARDSSADSRGAEQASGTVRADAVPTQAQSGVENGADRDGSEQQAPERQQDMAQGPWYTVASGSAELRDEPKTNAAVRDRLAYGMSVKVLEQRPGWRRVERADGDAAGWVGAFVLTPDDAANRRAAAEASARAERSAPADVGTGGG